MHEPVLVKEVVDLLAIRSDGIYIDGTVGSGGHAAAIIEKLGPRGKLLCIDRDGEAVERARQALGRSDRLLGVVHGNYADMVEIAERHGIDRADGVILDLGVSSEQLESSERGFSFAKDGPLDMRMDRSEEVTAERIVNELPEGELCSILRNLGEERYARRIARVLVREREDGKIRTTGRLAELVARTVGRGRTGRNPATRTFQALRMKVNEELRFLEAGLAAGLRILADNGRMAVVTFHSLEDRLVKDCFARHAGRWESLQAGGRRWMGSEPRVVLVNRKPVRPGDEEMTRNPRARSAKLRVVGRLQQEC